MCNPHQLKGTLVTAVCGYDFITNLRRNQEFDIYSTLRDTHRGWKTENLVQFFLGKNLAKKKLNSVTNSKY